MLIRRGRSSQDAIDYLRERDRLLVRLEEKAAEKHRLNSEQSRRHRDAEKADRNMEMARDFEIKRDTSRKSKSALRSS